MIAIDELTEMFLADLRRGCEVSVYDGTPDPPHYDGPTVAQIGARLVRREEPVPPQQAALNRLLHRSDPPAYWRAGGGDDALWDWFKFAVTVALEAEEAPPEEDNHTNP